MIENITQTAHAHVTVTNNNNESHDNGLFDDVWDTDTRFGTIPVVTSSNIVVKDWDDILNVYEPTHRDELIKPQSVKTEPPITVNVVKKNQPTKSKPPKVQLQSKNKKLVSRAYDSEDDNDDYDDTYDAYY